MPKPACCALSPTTILIDLFGRGPWIDENSPTGAVPPTYDRKQLFDAIKVEQGGRRSLQVNGRSTDATLYNVVIPEDAMRDYIDAMEDAMKVADPQDMAKDMLQAMGFDKSTINEIMSETGGTDIYGELAGILKQGVKNLGRHRAGGLRQRRLRLRGELLTTGPTAARWRSSCSWAAATATWTT